MTCAWCGDELEPGVQVTVAGETYCSDACRYSADKVGHDHVHDLRKALGQHGPCPGCGEVL